jgi:hypothetical protein
LDCPCICKCCYRVAVGVAVGVVVDKHRQRYYRYVLVYMSIGVVLTEKYRLTLYLLSVSLVLLQLYCSAIIVPCKKVGFFYFAPIVTWPLCFSLINCILILYVAANNLLYGFQREQLAIAKLEISTETRCALKHMFD